MGPRALCVECAGELMDCVRCMSANCQDIDSLHACNGAAVRFILHTVQAVSKFMQSGVGLGHAAVQVQAVLTVMTHHCSSCMCQTFSCAYAGRHIWEYRVTLLAVGICHQAAMA